jgi:hypothetical protein
MRSAFEQMRAFFHGCDYAAALQHEPANVLRVYLGAIDHVLDVKQNVGEEIARTVVMKGTLQSLFRFGRLIVAVVKPFLLNSKQGAAVSQYLATSPEVAQVSGEYFVKSKPANDDVWTKANRGATV